MLFVRQWHPEPIHEIPYQFAKSHGVTAPGQLPVTVAETDNLPDELQGIILTADLQAREAPTEQRREPRLLGQVAAEELEALCELKLLPPALKLGVVLAGDLWTEPTCTQRGGHGDVSE